MNVYELPHWSALAASVGLVPESPWYVVRDALLDAGRECEGEALALAASVLPNYTMREMMVRETTMSMIVRLPAACRMLPNGHLLRLTLSGRIVWPFLGREGEQEEPPLVCVTDHAAVVLLRVRPARHADFALAERIVRDAPRVPDGGSYRRAFPDLTPAFA